MLRRPNDEQFDQKKENKKTKNTLLRFDSFDTSGFQFLCFQPIRNGRKLPSSVVRACVPEATLRKPQRAGSLMWL